MKQNTTVMVFTNQLEAIRKQPRKVQKDLMAAMLCFLAFGEQPDFNGMVQRNKQLAESVWMLMLPVLERSRRLRCTDCPRANELEHATSKNRACPVRTDSPRANAHARAEEEIEIEEEREVEKESEERNLSFADADASVSSAPADDDPAYIRPGKKDNKSHMANTHTDTTADTPDRSPEPSSSGGPKKPKLQGEELYEAVREYFNANVHGRGIPEIKSLRGKRRRVLDARFREYGSDAVADVIAKASDSRFLNGDNRNSFVASFDWIMRPANFVKIWDGNYDDNRISCR